ncbi:MAG: hypothetical protein OXF39_03585 [Nitrospira sp.]|nr:hypothetical protein [Nitrospira sp.]
MAIATVTFRRCLVNIHEARSDEGHVGSRIFFDLNIEGREFIDVYADVRVNTEGDAALCVTSPRGYDGPLNLQVFQGLVEFYYRQVTGGSLDGLGLMLQDWMIEQEMVVQFET